ncbi:MAG TPA: dihydrolipoamide acetyltransferase family protein [Xanthomonadaceae bacterium]|nr:2-oxo acid dehydrogenase subunit E2 [Xanthomonadales bacterium]HRX99772.1 dihydrolipoamide acetyltransferase family protein [Xanthomonadaceae bacterium]
MSNKTFLLPDLGEGLPDAEIVEWHVKVGDSVELDGPLVSMETAKAVVDVPSPYTGKVTKLHGGPGDVINTGAALAEFELDPNAVQRAEASDTGHGHGHGGGHGVGTQDPAPDDRVVASQEGGAIVHDEEAPDEDGDAGTVVGAMESSNRVHVEQVSSAGGVKAVPAVRALAKKLKIDLARVAGSGKDGVITLKDVREAAERGDAALGHSPAPAPAARAMPAPAPKPAAAARPSPARIDSDAAMDIDEPIRGVRRNMVRTMSAAHAEVVPTTLMDDADIHAWSPGEDITGRLIRALVVASQTVPALNSWLNAKEGTLRRHSRVDVGIAVDTPDGLFVPALRNCERLSPQQIRQGITSIRDRLKTRSIPPEELRDYTIMLSNFGVFAGKYATPVVVPPCVAIVGAGRLFHEVVPVMGGLETHRIMPISITFDHRAATGGEAARFLRALLDDLQRAN